MSQVQDHQPTVLLCIGMAGSGKTTFLQRLNADLHAMGNTPYVVNLDPAVFDLPYTPNIDIRDTVNYKEVMRQYQLGPNGAILTSLNLFTTKFDQVLDVLARLDASENKRVTVDNLADFANESNISGGKAGAKERTAEEAAGKEGNKDNEEERQPGYVLIDTPGQIEIFTWSASGAIITEALATQHPTIVLYIIDTERCQRPVTFMSNMLYACSILYKTRLPMLLVFNKTDLHPADECIAWMQDVMLFQQAVVDQDGEDGSYMSSMVQSMGLVLEEFYQTLRVAAVSAFTGDGVAEVLLKVREAEEEYRDEYVPEMMRRAEVHKKRLEDAQQDELVKLMHEAHVDD